MALTLLRIFAIITMVVLGLLPLHALASPICTFTHSTIQLSYRGTPIAVDIYQPRRTIRPPVLFLIHGSAGLFTKPANSTTDTLDNFGEHTFARACYLNRRTPFSHDPDTPITTTLPTSSPSRSFLSPNLMRKAGS